MAIALSREAKSPSISPRPGDETAQKPSEPINSPLSFAEFLDWADAVAKSTPNSPQINLNQGREVLIYLGFPESTVDTAWQNFNRANK
jgi:hypothetical protein